MLATGKVIRLIRELQVICGDTVLAQRKDTLLSPHLNCMRKHQAKDRRDWLILNGTVEIVAHGLIHI